MNPRMLQTIDISRNTYQGPLDDDDSLTFGSYSTGMENINIGYVHEEPEPIPIIRQEESRYSHQFSNHLYLFCSQLVNNVHNAPLGYKGILILSLTIFVGSITVLLSYAAMGGLTVTAPTIILNSDVSAIDAINASESKSSSPSIYPTSNPSKSLFDDSHINIISPTILPSVTPTIVEQAHTHSTSNTKSPTIGPTYERTIFPTSDPTPISTFASTADISPMITILETFSPTKQLSMNPTLIQTSTPSIFTTHIPTIQFTDWPTLFPTRRPTIIPTMNPIVLLSQTPSSLPTFYSSSKPTMELTVKSSASPRVEETNKPNIDPTSKPTISPTIEQTNIPTIDPTSKPTTKSTISPTAEETNTPTMKPTSMPTNLPTESPTVEETNTPTMKPTSMPTNLPTESPTAEETNTPTMKPTSKSTNLPTESPTAEETDTPTMKPTSKPTNQPTESPTAEETNTPTMKPTSKPTNLPTESPTVEKTSDPTMKPTSKPTNQPTELPTLKVTNQPTIKPTSMPTNQPTTKPTVEKTSNPTVNPTSKPTSQPTTKPTVAPADAVFYVTGNTPYTFDDGIMLSDQIQNLPNDAKFLMHLGNIDFKMKTLDDDYYYQCQQRIYSETRNILLESNTPVFIIPGDEDYYLCPNPNISQSHWLDSFASFETNWNDSNLSVTRSSQKPVYFSFIESDILFIGIQLNGGPIAVSQEEWEELITDNVKWVIRMVQKSRDDVKSVVIFGHAKATPTLHQPFIEILSAACQSWQLPILYLHTAEEGESFSVERGDEINSFDCQYMTNVQINNGSTSSPLRVSIKNKKEERFFFG